MGKVNNEHPLAKAIVEHAKKFHSEETHIWPEARDFISVTGHGVKAKIGNKSVIVGNKSFMLSLDIDFPVEASEILMEEEEKAHIGITVDCPPALPVERCDASHLTKPVKNAMLRN
ncbi:putative copper-transporting ATPase 3 [Hordeum vulgare]|nr:putative copper-transporting ATPase 3 [Hordeum vulgare]